MANKKRVIIFDLDETLTESKSTVDEEMSALLSNLLDKYLVAIISGGAFKQFQKQLLDNLHYPASLLKNLFILPTSGASFWIYKQDQKIWQAVYKEPIPDEDKERIKESLNKAILESGVEIPMESLGERVEDRETQISFSALGQEAPIALKKKWDPDQKKREKIIEVLKKYLPEYDIKFGGTTTIDITKKGIDKGYGVVKMLDYLKISKDETLFIGDKLSPNGNDYPVKAVGIDSLEVKNPEETKAIIKKLLVSDL